MLVVVKCYVTSKRFHDVCQQDCVHSSDIDALDYNDMKRLTEMRQKVDGNVIVNERV